MKRFADFDVDGLRTDTAGHLYVARILKGHRRGSHARGQTAN
jgi:hypothetical protein